MGLASAKVFGAWYFDDHDATFDGSSYRFAFTSDSLRKQATVIESAGIRGTRSSMVESVRQGPYTVSGTLTTDVTPVMLDYFLPLILGGAESTDTFGIEETLPEFDVICDRVAGTFKYSGCRVNRATFRGSKGQLVSMSLDIIGETETTGESVPSVTLDTAAGDYPYAFTDSTVSIYSGSRSVNDFELTIDNVLVPNGYNTSTAVDITTTDRIVTFRTNTRFTSTELSALYDKGLTAGTVTLTLTNNNMSTVFALGRFQPPANSPIIDQNPEVTLPLEGIVRGITGSDEIIVTNDPNDAS